MASFKIKNDPIRQVTYIYDLLEDKMISEIPSIKASVVMMYLKGIKTSVDALSIPLRKPYLEAGYGMGRYVKVIISKDELLVFVGHLLGQDYVNYMEEVAASGLCEKEPYDIGSFIQKFYEAKTREEAEGVYNSWQERLPLNDQVFYKFLRVFESYREELLNYFD